MAVTKASTDDQLFLARLRRAGSWRNVGNKDVAFAEYSALEILRPKHQGPIWGIIGVLNDLKNFEEAQKRLDDASTRFPNSAELLRIRANILNQSGEEPDIIEFIKQVVSLPKLEDARREQLVKSVLASRRGHFFLPSSREAIRAACDVIFPKELIEPLLVREPAEVNLAQVEKLISHNIPGSLPWVQAVADKTHILIEMDRAEEAGGQIDILRATVATWPYFPPKYAQLSEWLDIRRGAVREAQQSWRRRRTTVNGRDRTSELSPVRLFSSLPPPVSVICQVRNERVLIEPFLAHYRRGGIERFTFVDNGSDDGTLEFLEGQPDVELYSTRESFRRARAGNDWINPLIARPEYASTLCLRVDADEHMVFPGYEERSFDTLWRFMQSEGAEAIHGIMVDVFPEYLSLLDQEGHGLFACRYFDPEYIRLPMADCPYIRYAGGTRARLFDKFQSLGKVSGIRGGGAIEYIAASHSCSPARVSSVSHALLHYKFYPGFLNKTERIIREKQYAMASQEYAHFITLADRLEERLPRPDSVIFEGSNTLLANGLCQSPPAWQNFR